MSEPCERSEFWEPGPGEGAADGRGRTLEGLLAWIPRTPAAGVTTDPPLLEDETPVSPGCEKKRVLVLKVPGMPEEFPLVECDGVLVGLGSRYRDSLRGAA